MSHLQIRRRFFMQLVSVLTIAAMLAGGCAPGQPPEERAGESLLFWHEWQGEDAVVLNELLEKYTAFNPNMRVITDDVAETQMYDQFVSRFEEGIEPDMILTDWVTAQDLIEKGYVKDIAGLVDTSIFDDALLSIVKDGESVYGLPFTTSTQMLFYNKETVPVVPVTLDELMTMVAHRDYQLGLNTLFTSAFWGVRLFGGRAYDETGKLQLEEGAFINWLTALKNIQTSSGFLLSDDQDQLRERFIEGSLELYIANAREYDELYAALGDKLGVARLPVSSVGNPSGPIQQASALLISRNAGEQETQRALDLARFLTNPQQQALFTQAEIGRLPANRNVRISPSMNDLVVELAKQMRSAVPISLSQRRVWEKIAERAQQLYSGVLEGVIDIYTGAGEVRHILNEVQGRRAEDALSAETVCPTITEGRQLTLTLWHGWTEAETAVLDELRTEFSTLCPNVTIVSEREPDNLLLNKRYRESLAEGGGPDLLLDSTQFLATLAVEGLIRPISDVVDPTRLSQFVPSTVSSMRHHGQLFGYPEASRSVALIYNPTLVETPAQTLDDLLLQVDLEHQFAMPLSFFYSFWGLGAFGGRLFDDNRKAVLDEGGMVEWLEWLRNAADRPGFVFTENRPPAEDLFIQRKAAFLVSGPWSLPKLYAAMPKEEIAVTMLPAGPRNVASPMLEVEAFMLNPVADADVVQAGLAFARFVTATANAARLLETGVHVPANVTLDTSSDPIISGFRDQTFTAYPAVQDEFWTVALDNGDALYRETVLGNQPAGEAVTTFNNLINETNAALGK